MGFAGRRGKITTAPRVFAAKKSEMVDNAVSSRHIGLQARRLLGAQLVAWLGVISLFAWVYRGVVPALARDWYENETFSYGFLIPLIAAYLAWQRRERLKGLSVKPSVAGVLPLSAALALALVGQAIGDVFSVRISMLLALGSIVYLLLGWEFLRVLGFPLFYLFLMIPAPYVLIKGLTYHLRYLDAAHAAHILELLGIPVFVEAYFIYLPNMQLEVADVCSGVSSVFALLALGILYAYFLPIRPSLKVFLVACTFPFAMLANLVRIVVIAVLAYNIGPVVFQTTFHWLTGTTVFTLALIMLLSTGELLRRKFSVAGAAKPAQRPAVEPAPAAGSAWLPYFAAIFALSAALVGSQALEGGRKMRFDFDSAALAASLGGGVSRAPSEDLYKDQNADAALSFVLDKNKVPVEVFVAYRGEQAAGRRLSSPKLVFPDHWNSVWLEPAEIQIRSGASIRGNWMLTRKGDSLRLVLYWYQIGEETLAGELENRLRQLKRAMLERRTDGAVVRLATPVSDGVSIERAQDLLGGVARQLYPELVRILPR